MNTEYVQNPRPSHAVSDPNRTSDDDIVSSDTVVESSPEGNDSKTDNENVYEDGHDIQTHGGGRLEEVDGFSTESAMLSVIGSPDPVPVSPELWHLPRSCDLEYADMPESVCGKDDRVLMTKVSQIPWRMICQLIITRADGRKSRCTGWFISPRTVMTAGHCVYSHGQGGGWAQSIEVIPGMHERLRPFGSVSGKVFKSVNGWTRSSKPEFDYGCIVLPKESPLGSKTGWFGFSMLADQKLKAMLANNSGYPGDKPFGSQWYNAGRISEVSDKRFTYMLDTAGGQSGSCVWIYANGKRHVIGIHAYGGCPNKSTRINRAVFDNMMRWKALGQQA